MKGSIGLKSNFFTNKEHSYRAHKTLLFCILRILWALIVLGGFTFSVYFCRQLYVKWEDNPTLTTVESNFHLIKDALFPAVTICNANKVSMRKLIREMTTNNKYYLILIVEFFKSASYLFGIPRYTGIPISKMQETLSFLTNLDQTVGNKEKMVELDQFYKANNISTKDLFHLLRDVSIPINTFLKILLDLINN